MIVVCASGRPRSAIISTKSRRLSLNRGYHRTHTMMTSRSKWRPSNNSSMLFSLLIADLQCVQLASVADGAGEICTRARQRTKSQGQFCSRCPDIAACESAPLYEPLRPPALERGGRENGIFAPESRLGGGCAVEHMPQGSRIVDPDLALSHGQLATRLKLG